MCTRIARCAVISGLLLFVPTSYAAPTPQKSADKKSDNAPRLRHNKPVVGNLTGEQTYRVKMKAGQFLRLTVEPKDVKLTVVVLAPNGQTLLETDRQADDKEPPPLAFVADEKGYYTLRLRARDNTSGAYRLAIAERRAATAQDRNRLTADRIIADARKLRDEKKPEALRTARTKLLVALPLLRDLQDRAGEASALHNLGAIADDLSEKEAALEHFNQALVIRRELKDRKREATTLNAIADIYQAQQNFRKELEYRLLAQPIYHELNEVGEEGVTLANIGVTHFQLDAASAAIEAFERALPLLRQAKDTATEIATHTNMAQLYDNLGQLPQAVAAHQRALELQRAEQDRAGQANSLLEIAALARQQGNYKQTIEYCTQSLELWRAVGNRNREALTLNFMGLAYKGLGELATAMDYYRQALTIARETGNRGMQGILLNNLAVISNEAGNYRPALEYHEQALALRRESKDRTGEGASLFNIGAVYNSLGESEKAFDYYRQAIVIYRELKRRDREAEAFHAMAEVYDRLGEKQQSFDHSQQALAICKELNLRPLQTAALTNLATLYSSLGERQQALDIYNQALALARAMGAQQIEANLLNHISDLYVEQGKYEEARDYLMQALPLWQRVGDKRGEAEALVLTGSVQRALGEKQRALELLNQSLPLHEETGNRAGRSDTYLQLGLTYRELGDDAKALEAFTRSLALSREVTDPNREIDARFRLAKLQLDGDNLADARTNIEAALKLAETIRGKISGQDLRASYFASAQQYYDLYVDLLMRLHERRQGEGFDGQALQANERARARGLLDLLTEAGANIRSGVDADLLARERTLQQQINRRAEGLLGARTDERIAGFKREIDALTNELREVQAEIRRTSPRYAALTQPQPLTLREIQRQVLDPETVLLEYALGAERSFLWVVTDNSIRSFTLPKRAEIEPAAQRVYELLTTRNTTQRGLKLQDTPETADAEYWRAADALSRMVITPAAQHLRQLGKKRLVVVADGALQYVLFGALPSPMTEQRNEAAAARRTKVRSNVYTSTRNQPLPPVYTPLVVEYEIISLPSASTIAVLRREQAGRPVAPKTVAVIADPVFDQADERVKPREDQPRAAQAPMPNDVARGIILKKTAEKNGAPETTHLPRLPFTRDEAERIVAAAPPDTATKALDFMANRAAVTSDDLSQYRIVHLATHGFLDTERPELSALLLSLIDEQGNPQDGFLRAHEVYNLNLPVELVVLSACETGLGKEVKGEGLVGLTRGFMYAGAARVVVSLWSVNDKATAELMTRFYRKMLTDNQRPAAALRAAQVEMWKEQRYQAPYYWAAFVLQGEWR